jgi:hypothetical protein
MPLVTAKFWYKMKGPNYPAFRTSAINVTAKEKWVKIEKVSEFFLQGTTCCAPGMFKQGRKEKKKEAKNSLAHAEMWSDWDSKPVIARLQSVYADRVRIFILQRCPFSEIIVFHLAFSS